MVIRNCTYCLLNDATSFVVLTFKELSFLLLEIIKKNCFGRIADKHKNSY